MATERAAMELLITTELNKAKADLKDLHSSLKNIESVANTMGNALKGGLAALGMKELAGGIGAIIQGTMEWDRTAAQLTAQLNGNAVMATTWMALAKASGVENITLQRSFAHLSTEIVNNSSTLREMGIATVDAKGKYLSMGQIVAQITDYFHAHAGATNEGELATKLFARSGVELIPILELGSAGIQKLSDQLRKYGYVVEAEALQRNVQFDYQLREGQLALEGLGMAITHAAMPGLAMLGRGLSSLIEQNLPQFIAMIQKAVSFVIGFFQGLLGIKLEISDTALELGKLGTATTGYGDATGKAAGGAGALAQAERDVRAQAKAATEAINDQIKALENQTALENYADTQRKLALRHTDEKKKVDQDYAAYQNQLLHGHEAAAMDQLTNLQAAEQSYADTSIEIDKGAKQEQRRTLIDQLREQEKAINESADKQIAAMQRAAAGSSAAIAGVAAGIPGMWGTAGEQAGAKMGFALNKASEQAGKDMAENFKKGDWGAIGNKIGEGIMAGIGSGLGKGALSLIGGQQVGSNELKVLKELFGGLIKNFENTGNQNLLRGYASGGTVPGPIGAPQLAMVHGGETITPAGKSASTINIYVNGADSPERTAQVVANHLGALMAA